MPTLSSKNINGAISDIEKKGFRTKFWRDHRSHVAKGQGVGKHMDALEKLGVTPDGKPDKADLDSMGEIVQLFTGLSNAMLKAEGKCGVLQKETKKLCTAYRKVIRKREDVATKLAQNADKIKLAQAQAELKRQKENEATDKKLAQYKKEADKKRALLSKEVKVLSERGAKLAAAAKMASKEINKAATDMNDLIGAFEAKHDKEGTNNAELEVRVLKGLETIHKKQNIEMHSKNIKGAFPKLLKEVTESFKQYVKVDGIKTERLAAAKNVKDAQDSFTVAQDDVKLFETQYKIATNMVATARKEGG